MTLDVIQVSSLKIKFESLLDIIDNAIKKSKPIQIPKEVFNQKNNNIKLLKWLQRHKIIDILSLEKPIQVKKKSIRSRERKIEISLLLKALGVSNSDISKRFKVQTQTVQGYFKNIGKYDNNYLKILNNLLSIIGVSKNTILNDFPNFPIRINIAMIRERISSTEFEHIERLSKENKLIKFVTGQRLGTRDLLILFPEK